MPGKDKPNRSQSTDSSMFEKIVGQRTRGGKTYYKVRWNGRPVDTWVLEENLSPQKVAQFKENLTSAAPSTSSSSKVVGFERGLEPEKILGMYEVDKQLMFKMKWKGSDTSDFVPVDEAKVKCPQVVIEYYEQRISWI